MKALPVSAGLRKFFPVPPKSSLPTTIPKAIPLAACHNGLSGGQLRENSTVETNAPSFISCLLIVANIASQAIPTTKTVAYIGKK